MLRNKIGIFSVCVLCSVIFGAFCMSNVSAETSAPAKAAEVKSDAKSGDTVVAKGDSFKVTLGQVESKLGELPAEMQNKADSATKNRIVRDGLIYQTIVLAQAEKDGLRKSPEVQKMIKEAEERVLISECIRRAVSGKVTDAMAKKKYEEISAEYKKDKEIKMVAFVAKDETSAKAITTALEKGTDPKKVEKDNGVTAQGGEEAGYTLLSRFPTQVVEVLGQMKSGSVTKAPIKVGSEFFVVKVFEIRNAVPPAFDDVKSQLVRALEMEETKTFVKGLEKKDNVQRFMRDGVTPDKSFQDYMEEQSAASEKADDKKSDDKKADDKKADEKK